MKNLKKIEISEKFWLIFLHSILFLLLNEDSVYTLLYIKCFYDVWNEFLDNIWIILFLLLTLYN